MDKELKNALRDLEALFERRATLTANVVAERDALKERVTDLEEVVSALEMELAKAEAAMEG